MKIHNFAITGVAGFVAPRHLKAIKETGNILIAALDPHDSVGILDQYFPKANFFTETERFDRYLEKLRLEDNNHSIEFLSICSPNFLHDAHCRLALRAGANAICEKPLVIAPWNLDALRKIEIEQGKRIFTVLQLRLHPKIIELKQKIASDRSKWHKVKLTYITPRGEWYRTSWKGNAEKSGGIATNIGIHLFDLLIWLFGKVEDVKVYYSSDVKMGGRIILDKAQVDWFLSIDMDEFPNGGNPSKPLRSIEIDDEVISFSDGFTDLHTDVYKKILEGNGWGIEDVYSAIELAHKIRTIKVVKREKDCHPMLINQRPR